MNLGVSGGYDSTIGFRTSISVTSSHQVKPVSEGTATCISEDVSAQPTLPQNVYVRNFVEFLNAPNYSKLMRSATVGNSTR